MTRTVFYGTPDLGFHGSSDKVAGAPLQQPSLSCLQHLDVCPTPYWDSIWQRGLFPCPASNTAIRLLNI